MEEEVRNVMSRNAPGECAITPAVDTVGRHAPRMFRSAPISSFPVPAFLRFVVIATSFFHFD
jgi:hypothetical protein